MSAYLDYLPAVYRQDEFMGRFLLVFESILGPLENVVDELPLYTDPTVCPEEMLPYLARWVSLEMSEAWPVARKRRMIRMAAEMHRWRGTRRGLKLFLQGISGVEPLLAENTDGSRLGPDNRLGLSTRLGRPVPHAIAVTLPVEGPDQVDATEVAELLEAEKPAHTVCMLRIVARQPRSGKGGGADGAALSEPAATEKG